MRHNLDLILKTANKMIDRHSGYTKTERFVSTDFWIK